jgi:hypothetical protein
MEAIGDLTRAMDPKKSPTFRKGKSGDWKQHFSEDNKRLFKVKAGDVLIRLGYEKDNEW